MAKRKEIIINEGHSKKIISHGKTLEVNVLNRPYQGSDRSIVEIESPLNPGVRVETVDRNKDPLAPIGAVYVMTAYMPVDNHTESLNGDVYQVHVGPQGIILNDSALKRAAEIWNQKKPKIS